jgi:aminomethyltransferase
VVKPAKGEFLGRAAAVAAREAGGGRKLVGLTCAGPVPRPGCPLTLDGGTAGVVTSGTYSPCLKTGIALGYLPRAADPAKGVSVVVRGRPLPATVVKLPFFKSGGVAVVAKSAA